MYKVWSLTKMLLKNNYADILGKRNKLWLYVLAWFGFMTLAFTTIGLLAFGMYEGLEPYGQQGVILGVGLTAASIWVFLFSITSILTVFYYEDDVERLLPLPIQPSQIVTAKFITVLLTQYVTSSFFLFPILVVFGIQSGAFIPYYIYSFIVFLCFPIIPLVIVSLLMTVVMRFTNISKNKDRSRLIVGMLSLLFIVGMNIFAQSNRDGQGTEQMMNWIASDQGALLASITKYVPTSYISSLALMKSGAVQGLLYLLLFIAASLVCYGIFFAAAQRYYMKGIIGLSASHSKKRALTRNAFEKTAVQRSKWKTYVKKELLLLFRTPVFFLNCIVNTFIMPVIFFFAFFTQNDSVMMLKEYTSRSESLGLALGIAFCAGMFLLGSNMTATTAFSRDGGNWFTNRYMPVPASTIIFAKVFTAWFISASVLLLFTTALLAFQIVSPLFAFLFVILCLTGLWLNNLIGVRWDARTADVHWENEQKMFKGRYTPLFSFFVNGLIAAGTLGLVLLLYFILHAGMWAMFFVLLVVYVLLSALVHRSTELAAERILSHVE